MNISAPFIKRPIGISLLAIGLFFAGLLCYLRLHVELALRAKGILLLRESGIDAPPLDEETQSKLVERGV